MGLRSKISVALIAIFVLMTGLFASNTPLDLKRQEAIATIFTEQKSITFLMGEDHSGQQYFQLAEEHFLFSETEKTDILIKTCRSFEDLINYLNQNHKTIPWSTIQVVLHGNPYTGLSIPLSNEGARATPQNMVKALMDQSLPKINSNAIDCNTKINFWACGIGENPFINIAIDGFFKLPDGNTPQIFVTSDFVIFKASEDGSVPQKTQANYWPFIFKRGYRPGDLTIANTLKKQFPEAKVNWKAAIQKSTPEQNRQEFQNTFHIPVSWTVIYPTKKSRPSVSTHKEKIQWVRSQKELMSQIQECNIPIDKFTWTINKIIHTNKEGKKVPAIKAIGMATVLCILKE